MNGLEPIELMKQGKMIKSCIWIYSMDSDGVIWLKTESHTGWVEAHTFNILANDYEEYIEPKPLTGWERVDGKMYNVILINDLGKSMECGQFKDDMYYKQANYFSTEEKAEEINFKQTLFRKLQRFSDENGGNEINWLNTNQQKFFITYYYDTKELDLYYVCNDKDFGQVYFISEEIAEKAIELFRDELIKYFTHDWSGKDETPINLNSEER